MKPLFADGVAVGLIGAAGCAYLNVQAPLAPSGYDNGGIFAKELRTHRLYVETRRVETAHAAGLGDLADSLFEGVADDGALDIFDEGGPAAGEHLAGFDQADEHLADVIVGRLPSLAEVVFALPYFHISPKVSAKAALGVYR
jgi:hypothetical protein